MLAVLAGLPVSLLPEAWRSRWFSDVPVEVRTGAILTGAAQLLGCLAILGYRYPAFVRSQMSGGVGTAAMSSMEKGGETAVMGLGPLLLVAYLIQPLSLVLGYFMVEGVVRVTAAVVSGEELGTLP